MFNFEISSILNNKLKKKNKKEFNIVMKKILDISKSNKTTIEHYKNLKKPMQYLKRVHVNNSFVLLFEYKKDEAKIFFIDYSHHNNAYKN